MARKVTMQQIALSEELRERLENCRTDVLWQQSSLKAKLLTAIDGYVASMEKANS